MAFRRLNDKFYNRNDADPSVDAARRFDSFSSVGQSRSTGVPMDQVVRTSMTDSDEYLEVSGNFHDFIKS